MGVADTARKRDRSEAKTRARLKYMVIIVRWAGVGVGVVWGSSTERGGGVVGEFSAQLEVVAKKRTPFYREDILQIGEGMFRPWSLSIAIVIGTIFKAGSYTN